MSGHPALRRLPTPRLSDRQRLGKMPIHVYTWGRGDFGQLGLGDTADQGEPTLVEGLEGKDIIHVAAGEYHTAFLTGEGEVYMVGSNEMGQVGVSGEEVRRSPVRVAALDTRTVTHIACGASHTVAVTDVGSLASWGASELGQLGLSEGGPSPLQLPHPRIVKGSRERRFARVACGANHTLALTGSGEVYSFGQGALGALGHGNTRDCHMAVQVAALWGLGVVQVACGENHSAALTVEGQVYTWGRGKYGQLGQGGSANETLPTLVPLLPDQSVVQIACGGDHTMAVAAEGALFTWGRGHWGQTGHGTTDDVAAPKRVEALANERVLQVSAGVRHSLAMVEGERAYGWGDGEQLQLGKGDNALGETPQSQLAPTLIPGLPQSAGRLLFLVGGGEHSVAVFQQERGEGGGKRPRESVSQGQPMSTTDEVHGEGSPVELDAVSANGKVEGATPQTAPSLLEANLAIPPMMPPSQPLLMSDAEVSVEGREGQTPSSQHASAPAPDEPPPEEAESGVSDEKKGPGEEGEGVPGVGIPLPPAGSFSEGPLVFRAETPNEEDSPTPPPAEEAGRDGTPGLTGQSERRIPEEVLTGAVGERQVANGEGLQDNQRPLDAHGAGLRPLKIPSLRTLILESKALGQTTPETMHALEDIFSSAAFPLACFRAPPGGAAGGPGLDHEAIRAVYQNLLELFDPQVLRRLASSMLRLLEGAEAHLGRGQPRSASWTRILLVLLQTPLLGEPGVGDGVSARLFHVLARLAPSARKEMVGWLQTYPKEVLGGRFIRGTQRFIASREQMLGGRQIPPDIAAAIKVLGMLYEANQETDLILHSEFYSAAVSRHASLQDEYIKWRELGGEKGDGVPFVSFCQAPFVLTPEAKSKILQVEAALEKSQQVQASLVQHVLGNQHATPILLLTVRRQSLVQDALQQLASHHHDLKKPLKVVFSGEDAVDEGGVAKEFFQLLIRDLFNVSYGMFTYDKETRSFWFSRDSLASELEFQLVGVTLGLAIYNGVILDVHFPPVVYKKLLREPVGLADLRAVQPQVAKGLQALLEFEGEVEDTFGAVFQVEYEYFGEIRRHDLIPNGGNVAVTNENRKQYGELYVKYTLEDSIQEPFSAFSRGFLQVCGGPALTLFRHEELELLVCGLPHFDFEALERVVKYDGGFSKDSPVVHWFWDLVRGMSFEDKKRLLFFTTGNDRSPIGGLGTLSFIIIKNGPDTDRLPTSHTCFNVLMLPEYSSKSKLEDRLKLAIQNATGFGLQ